LIEFGSILELSQKLQESEMSPTRLREKVKENVGRPTWEVAYLFPAQGQWAEEEYLALNGNRMLELSRGCLEVLPVPTTSHQQLVAYLYGLLLRFVTERGLGTVLFAPLRVKVGRGKFREPDLVFMLTRHSNRIAEEYWDGADLVVEVVSDDPESRPVISRSNAATTPKPGSPSIGS
jgi:hypothetical protein